MVRAGRKRVGIAHPLGMRAPFGHKRAVNIEIKPVPSVRVAALAGGEEIEADYIALLCGNGGAYGGGRAVNAAVRALCGIARNDPWILAVGGENEVSAGGIERRVQIGSIAHGLALGKHGH